ncbi:MAG TPA: NAD(P)H-hydrate epimerase, partial [Nitrososphaerales archaeon]|nr:NAD(P)H-hydrate epimerase [Nitrososphaerales archaeon]
MKTQGRLAYLTAEEMAEADRLAIDGLGMSVDSLMENAGTKTAEVAKEMLGGDAAGRRVAVLVGRGNNGGDGLVAAMHLHNWGADVSVAVAEGVRALRDVPARKFATVEKMGLRTAGPEEELESELIVDALLGYGSKGSPREPLAGLIRRANESGTPI